MASSSAGRPTSDSSRPLGEIQDDIFLQKSIIESLREVSAPGQVGSEIEQAEKKFQELQREFTRARWRQPSASSGPAHPNKMNIEAGPQGGYNGGPGSPAPSASGWSWGTPNSRIAPPRKRSFGSHLGSAQPFTSESKSRRTTPEPPFPTTFSSPSPSLSPEFDAAEVIDLTGDDDRNVADIINQHRLAEERFHLNKRAIDRDAELARDLQSHVHDRSDPPSPATDASFADPFGRILSRNSETPEVGKAPTLPLRSSQAAPAPRTSARPGTNTPNNHGDLSANATTSGSGFGRSHPHQPQKDEMPGGFPDTPGSSSDDMEIIGTASRRPGDQFSSPYKSSPFGNQTPSGYGSGAGHAVGHAPNVSATELARRAALGRQSAGSGGSGMMDSRSYSHNGHFGASITPSPSDFSNAGLFGNGSGLARSGAPMPGPFGPPSVWQSSPETWRPGYYVDGTPTQFCLPSDVRYGSSSSAGATHLSSIIARTSAFDFRALTDGRGNPLSDRYGLFADEINDPKKTTKEILKLLSNIQRDAEVPKEDWEGTPDGLNNALYPHQRIALKWMVDMEQGSNSGGILADDMGLGKTISTIALMLSRKSTEKIKTTLIVGPVALIKQWETEISQKVKREHALTVYTHQSGKKTTFQHMRKFDIVLTTYGMLASELKRYTNYLEQHGDSSDLMNDTTFAMRCPFLHPASSFYRVILDEAQCIKNAKTVSARSLGKVRAKHRWCLTGTPMMNGVDELASLIQFLQIKPYCDPKEFKKDFGCLYAGKNATGSMSHRQSAMEKLRVVLKAIMLRRTKSSKIDGKPILELPPKTEEGVHVALSVDEQKFYSDLEERSRVEFNKYLRAGTVSKHYSNILVLLLRLRQACCHPHLLLDVEYSSQDISDDAMADLAKQLEPNVVARIKESEAFECPICLDAVPDPSIIIPCGHDTCSECLGILTAPENAIRRGDENGSAKCPECRGNVDPKKIITYSVFKRVHMPQPETEEKEDEPDSDEYDYDSLTDDDDLSETEGADDVDVRGNLKGFIVDDEADDEDGEDEKDGPEFPNLSKGANKDKKKARQKQGKRKATVVKPHQLKWLRKEATKSREKRKIYMHYLHKHWQTSAKVQQCADLLSEIQKAGEEKTIIFSQWTMMLDLLEVPLKHELKIKYRRYDGGMSRPDREEAISAFMGSDEVKVIMVSLRAGNAGLNLTAANNVIILDPFWNPYIEMQAVDRAHRIGQNRPVKVHRILTKGTIEDRIVELQNKKRELVDAALDEGEAKRLGRLSTGELQYLFG